MRSHSQNITFGYFRHIDTFLDSKNRILFLPSMTHSIQPKLIAMILYVTIAGHIYRLKNVSDLPLWSAFSSELSKTTHFCCLPCIFFLACSEKFPCCVHRQGERQVRTLQMNWFLFSTILPVSSILETLIHPQPVSVNNFHSVSQLTSLLCSLHNADLNFKFMLYDLFACLYRSAIPMSLYPKK